MTNTTDRERHTTASRSRKFAGLLLLVFLSGSATGCVHRRVTVRTEPPGAQVLLNDQEIGYSPASFDVTWYGTEEVTLLKDGYEIETHQIKIPTPWYQVPPLDFVTDNFLPFRIKNHHEFNFALRRYQGRSQGELLERGRSLRSESQLGQ